MIRRWNCDDKDYARHGGAVDEDDLTADIKPPLDAISIKCSKQMLVYAAGLLLLWYILISLHIAHSYQFIIIIEDTSLLSCGT